MASINLAINVRNNQRYARITETFRDPVSRKNTSRCLKSLGNIEEKIAQDPTYIDQLRQLVLQLRANPELADRYRQQAGLRVLPDISQQSAFHAVPRWYYGAAAIRQVWERLGLDRYFNNVTRNARLGFDLDLAVFSMVANRFFGQYSRLKQHRLCCQHLFDFQSLTLDNLYEALSLCAERKKTILDRLDKGVKQYAGRSQALVFYDVTTFYFESFEPDELRRRGMSKEHRTHETQVVMGLLIDDNGIPITYEVFPGNTAEQGTLLHIVDEYKQRNPQGRCIVVADRGLNCKDNLTQLKHKGCEFIVAQSLAKMNQSDQEEALNDQGWVIKTHADGEVVWRHKHCKKYSEVFLAKNATERKRKLKELERQRAMGQELKEDLRLVVTWSAKRYYNDIKEINQAWEKSKALLNQGCASINSAFKKGNRRYLQASKEGGQTVYKLDNNLYQQQIRLAGYYAVVTNVPIEQFSDEEVYTHLRQLSQIEENFRMMKSLLQSRPVFVWKPERIKGHFLTCVLALSIERLMLKQLTEAGFECSADRLVELLQAQTLSPVKDRRSDRVLLLKTCSDELDNPRAKGSAVKSQSEQADQMMEILGLKPLLTLDTLSGVGKRLGVKLPYRTLL